MRVGIGITIRYFDDWIYLNKIQALNLMRFDEMWTFDFR